MDSSEVFLHSVGRGCLRNGTRILRSLLTTTCEMMGDRGYSNVKPCADLSTSLKASSPICTARDGERDVKAYLLMEEKVGVRLLRSLTGDGSRVVIISQNKPTHGCKRENSEAIEFFTVSELVHNLTRHVLVPRHERVDSAPCSHAELPEMRMADPVCRYYGWKCGDVVRIERTFCGGEPIPYYRVVVAG